jgi:ABC-2 type transport system permease protein
MSVWHITAKDLYLLLRDRRTFAILVFLPLAFIAIIGLSTGQLLGWRNANQVLKIAMVDETDYAGIGSAEFMTRPGEGRAAAEQPLPESDRKAERNVARHIVADLFNNLQKESGVEVRTVEDWQKQLDFPGGTNEEETARQMAADEKINVALIFKPDFYRRVYHARFQDVIPEKGKRTPVERFGRIGMELVHATPGTSTATAVSAIIGLQVRDEIEAILLCRSGRLSVADRAALRAVCGPVSEMDSTAPDKLLPPQKEDGGERTEETYDRLVPSYTTMFVFFLVNIMARSFLTERDLGTMRRLRSAPISRWSILLGKTLPFLAISLLQTALLFLAGRLMFNMSWGPHPWMLLPVIFATSCAATGLGLLIATIVKTDAQVSAYANTVVIILAGISGCFMPRQWLPEAMQQVSLATPHAWALMAYDQLLAKANPDLTKVWQDAGMLMAFAVGFFLLGGLRFRKLD